MNLLGRSGTDVVVEGPVDTLPPADPGRTAPAPGAPAGGADSRGRGGALSRDAFCECEWDRADATAAARGDRRAFEALVRRHQPAALRVALALSGDAGTAEDVVQEAFLAAHRDLRRFDRARPFLPWLLGIVAHRAQTARRGRLRRLLREWPLDPRRWRGWTGAPLAPPATDGQPLAAVLRDEAARELWAAVGRLPAHQRRAVVLHYVGELPVEAVAAALGCPEGTVKSRLHHARRALAAALSSTE